MEKTGGFPGGEPPVSAFNLFAIDISDCLDSIYQHFLFYL